MGPGLEGPEGGNPSMDLGNPDNGDNDHRVIGTEDPPIGVPRGVDVRLEGSSLLVGRDGDKEKHSVMTWTDFV